MNPIDDDERIKNLDHVSNGRLWMVQKFLKGANVRF